MSMSKFVLGGLFVLAASVSLTPLLKKDFPNFFKKSECDSKIMPSGDDVIGWYEDQSVRRSDLTAQEKQALFDAEMKTYQTLEMVLSRRHFEAVVEKYAKEKKITDKAEAQRQFLAENISLPEAQVSRFVEENKENPRLKGRPRTEQEAIVRTYLMQQASRDFLDNFTEKAVARGALRVNAAHKPVAPQIDIDIAGKPIRGHANAPITIVEFADYQCPYCYTAEKTVHALLARYEGRVRFVFRNFPLSQMHPEAVPAAVAAECANQQGKFWEMHDVLFENHQNLQPTSYADFAKQIGLDSQKFETCFVNPMVQESIREDERYAQSLGISATPAFYVNGMQLMGAQPEEEFVNLIEKMGTSHKP